MLLFTVESQGKGEPRETSVTPLRPRHAPRDARMSASAADAEIRRILRAANHFDMLKLRRPHADLMDQPVWELTNDDVHRSFRKLSLSCHPDKSSHPDAPRAFEALKKAKSFTVMTQWMGMGTSLASIVMAATSWTGTAWTRLSSTTIPTTS